MGAFGRSMGARQWRARYCEGKVSHDNVSGDCGLISTMAPNNSNMMIANRILFRYPFLRQTSAEPEFASECVITS